MLHFYSGQPLQNLSGVDSGAMIDEALPGAAVNMPVTLVIDGISTELTGFVARKTETATVITFKLSDEARKVVEGLVSTRQAA